MPGKSKASKAAAISKDTALEVLERDNRRCIVCGNSNVQIAHYISRARHGLGIARNLACLCHKCHFDYDNVKYHKEIKNIFEEHLKAHYGDWDKKDLTYTKWSN